MTNKQKKKKILILSIVLAVVSLLCAFYNLINPYIVSRIENRFNIISNKNASIVHFISVGQGDAVAINLPDGKVFLIDAGPVSSNVTYTYYLNQYVLNSKRNKTIDYLVMTHADEDHIGGVLRLLQNFDVDTIYMPTVFNESQTFGTFLNYINEKDYNLVKMVDAEDLVTSDYTFKFFSPVSVIDPNESCPIIKFISGDKSFLFTGDIGKTSEAVLVEKYGHELDADILKVAHHGSKESSSIEFLKAVSPDYAVISCGVNSFGHPTEEVINNLTSVGAEIFRTDLKGNMIFTKSANYNLTFHSGYYTITSLSLDYRILILVVDAVVVLCIIEVLLRKTKRDNASI